MAETVRVAVDVRGVATLTLARPEKHNAMSGASIAEFHETARRMRSGERGNG